MTAKDRYIASNDWRGPCDAPGIAPDGYEEPGIAFPKFPEGNIPDFYNSFWGRASQHRGPTTVHPPRHGRWRAAF